MNKFMRAGIASKDLIITLTVMGIISALGAVYLFSANAANNAAENKNDIGTTFQTMFEKAKANNDTENFSLTKIFNASKGVYNINKKLYLKNINGKKVETAKSGIVTYGSAEQTAGAVDVPATSLPASTNGIVVVMGTSYDITDAACVDDTNAVVTTDFLDVNDTAASGNKTLDDVCRGGVSDDANQYLIYVLADGTTAETMNQKLFDNDGTLINAAGGTLNAIALKL